MKTFVSILAVALVMATSAAPSSEPLALRPFYVEAAQTNISQIELGHLARAKGTTPAIRMFAQHPGTRSYIVGALPIVRQHALTARRLTQADPPPQALLQSSFTHVDQGF